MIWKSDEAMLQAGTYIKRGITILVNLKSAALSAELGDETESILSKATGGCGMLTIATHIDNLITAVLHIQTELSHYRYLYKLSKEVQMQWEDLGFYENPEDMTEEQKQELRQIAARFFEQEEVE